MKVLKCKNCGESDITVHSGDPTVILDGFERSKLNADYICISCGFRISREDIYGKEEKNESTIDFLQ